MTFFDSAYILYPFLLFYKICHIVNAAVTAVLSPSIIC
jgi:hypothetical protein